VIFLLRLVAADRRAAGRRRPLASDTPTVGELEDEAPVVDDPGGTGAPPPSHASAAITGDASAATADDGPAGTPGDGVRE
jgi:hypothetical protein